MGNKLLIICLGAALAFANGVYPEIDALIEKVKVKRVGLSAEEIARLKNPFIDEERLKKVVKAHKNKRVRKRARLSYRLISILNDRAKINGRWYRVGSRVGGYRLAYVDPIKGFVVLRNKRRSLTLFVHKRSRKIRLFTTH